MPMIIIGRRESNVDARVKNYIKLYKTLMAQKASGGIGANGYLAFGGHRFLGARS